MNRQAILRGGDSIGSHRCSIGCATYAAPSNRTGCGLALARVPPAAAGRDQLPQLVSRDASLLGGFLQRHICIKECQAVAPAVLQAQLPGLARSWLQHLGQELDKGTVTVWNEELEGNLRLAEVVD